MHNISCFKILCSFGFCNLNGISEGTANERLSAADNPNVKSKSVKQIHSREATNNKPGQEFPALYTN
jgi:hypothetical protein